MRTTIYALLDPDRHVRYVGKTKQKPESRLSQHIHKALHRPTTHRDRWIAKMLREGFCPQVDVLCVVDGNGSSAERAYISDFRKVGARLTNQTDGGEGTPGAKLSAETRRKMSVWRLGRKFKPEVCQKISAARKGMKFTDEHRENLRKSHRAPGYKGRGRKYSKETRGKIAASVARAHADGRCVAPQRNSVGRFAAAAEGSGNE